MQALADLVEKFDRNLKQYKSSSYDEANVRVDFIDKFFTLLNWDVSNEKGYSEDYREVVREDKVIIQGKPKAPDYSFRIGGTRKFFVEAKKPSVDIKQAQAPAFQIRRYAYTAKLPLSILTDFEEFAVYDTRIKPDQRDDASVGRVFYCKFTDYEKEWDYLNGTFSPDSILTGSFDKYISDKKRQKGTSEVDKEFLNTIDKWRVDLAKDIAKNNKDLETYDINYAVQKIIDRIIFLRFAEDQNIEEYGSLKKFLEAENKVYPLLDKFFKKADEKYNSSLFKPEDYISDLDIEDKTLHSIIRGLYYPKCPYEFSVLPIEILGSIYEKFLGKTIRLTASHQAKVEEKPEVRKAGGVYYTPQYIVDYIVENTVGEKLKNRKPDDFTSTRKDGEKRGARHGGRALGDEVTGRDLSLGGMVIEPDGVSHQRSTRRHARAAGESVNDVHTLTVLDPACGSGSFLVRAYDYLLKWYLEQYSKKQSINKNIKDGKIYQVGDATYRLSIKTKQEILKRHIYGVDIDRQAVEVTKLSLLLKLMEGESEQTSAGFLRFDQAQLLPDLSENIKCGNSLIGSDFYQGKNLSLFGTEDMHKINAFDWDSPEGFGEIMKIRYIEKNWKTYHITWVTYGSRINEEMIKYGTLADDPITLSLKSRQIVSDALAKKIRLAEYRILACNVLSDYVHCVVVCPENEISDIVHDLKGYSSYTHNRLLELSVAGRGKQSKLWAKGFHKQELKTQKYTQNAIEYTKNNHHKHEEIPTNNRQLKQSVVDILSAYEPVKEHGGFDCVIGNPPYVRQETLGEAFKKYTESAYKTYAGTADLYVYFIEKGLSLIQPTGFYSIIVSNKWMRANYGHALRDFLKTKKVYDLIDFGDLPVFQGATTYPCIIKISNSKPADFKALKVKALGSETDQNWLTQAFKKESYKINLEYLSNGGWSLNTEAEAKLLEKVKSVGVPLEEYVDGKIYYGIKTGLNEAFVIDEETKERLIQEDPKSSEIIKPFLEGKDVKRYGALENRKWLIFLPSGFTNSKTKNKPQEWLKKKYPAIYNWLNKFETKAKKRWDKGDYWWELRPCDYYREFEKAKIIYPNILKKPEFTMDTEYLYTNQKCFIISVDDKTLLGILNSRFVFWLFKMILPKLRGDFYEPSFIFFGKFPIPHKKNDQLPVLVDQMLTTQNKLKSAKSEIDKKNYQQRIDILDKQIDALVYELYELTPEEIKIVEGEG